MSEGQDFVLQCYVGGVPVPEITWLLNGKESSGMQYTRAPTYVPSLKCHSDQDKHG